MGVWCKYCDLPTNSSNALQCDSCGGSVHFNCLQNGKPSIYEGDVLFDFICKHCRDGREIVKRMKLSWVQVIHLVLYVLTVKENGRQGFFRWKDEICCFINQHWNSLLPGKAKTSNWRSTVAGTLSVYCPKLFKSGQGLFNETGWWALVETKPPPKAYGDDVTKLKSTWRTRYPGKQGSSTNPDESPDTSFEPVSRSKRKRKMKNVYTEFMKARGASSRVKMEALSPDDTIRSNMKRTYSDTSLESVESDNASVDKPVTTVVDEESPFCSDSDNVIILPSKEDMDVDIDLSDDLISNTDDSNSLLSMEDIGASLNFDSQCSENGQTMDGVSETVDGASEIADTTKSEVTSLDGLSEADNSVDLVQSSAQQSKTRTKSIKQFEPPPEPKIIPMNPVQEKELLHKLNGLPKVVAANPSANRLRRKLVVRKLKRELGLPVFNLDETVQNMILKTAPKEFELSVNKELTFARLDSYSEPVRRIEKDDKKMVSLHHPALEGINVLDRFQKSVSFFHSR